METQLIVRIIIITVVIIIIIIIIIIAYNPGVAETLDMRDEGETCEGCKTLCINDGVADSLQRSCLAS